MRGRDPGIPLSFAIITPGLVFLSASLVSTQLHPSANIVEQLPMPILTPGLASIIIYLEQLSLRLYLSSKMR
jgi:hypothetical protein